MIASYVANFSTANLVSILYVIGIVAEAMT